MSRRPSVADLQPQLSDPAASRAVLISVHQYAPGPGGLENRPSVAAGRARLAALLRDTTVWGLPPEHCTEVSPTSREELLEAVHTAAAAATDTLVLYYAGHGLLYPRVDDLHLAVPTTRQDKAFTAVRYEDVRTILLEATGVRRKVVILDCCFSGTAARGALSGSDAARKADIAGASVLAASHATEIAWAPPGEPYPTFTAALIDVLDKGDPYGPELFTMADLYDRMRAALTQQNPQQLNSDRGASIAIARNRAPRPPAADAPLGEEEGARRNRGRIAVAVTAVAAVATGILLWVGLHDGASGSAAQGPSPILHGLRCGKAASSFDTGDGVVRQEVSVKVVHDAACRGDFAAMEVAMDRSGFDGTGGSARRPDAVVAAWEARGDRAAFLQALVTTLEQRPEVGQGGLTYRYTEHVAEWERGAGTVPDSSLRWAGYFDCAKEPDHDEPACS